MELAHVTWHAGVVDGSLAQPPGAQHITRGAQGLTLALALALTLTLALTLSHLPVPQANRMVGTVS